MEAVSLNSSMNQAIIERGNGRIVVEGEGASDDRLTFSIVPRTRVFQEVFGGSCSATEIIPPSTSRNTGSCADSDRHCIKYTLL